MSRLADLTYNKNKYWKEAERRGTVQNRMQTKNTQFESFGHDVTGGGGGSIDLHPININPYPVLALEPGQIGYVAVARLSCSL